MNANIYIATQVAQIRYLQTDNPAVLTKLILAGWRIHSPAAKAHACTVDPRTDGPYWVYEKLEVMR